MFLALFHSSQPKNGSATNKTTKIKIKMHESAFYLTAISDVSCVNDIHIHLNIVYIHTLK